MVVYYPRTVWKNSYAQHKVTGKTYNNLFFLKSRCEIIKFNNMVPLSIHNYSLCNQLISEGVRGYSYMWGVNSITSYLWVQVWVNSWPSFEFCQLQNYIYQNSG